MATLSMHAECTGIYISCSDKTNLRAELVTVYCELLLLLYSDAKVGQLCAIISSNPLACQCFMQCAGT